MFSSPQKNHLVFRYDSETLLVESWGPNALRIRATHEATLPAEDWALTETLPGNDNSSVEISDAEASIANGSITATISKLGKLTITNGKGKTLLEEFSRIRLDVTDPKCSALNVEAREFQPRLGSDSWHLRARFEADPDEQIFGMGQYQQPFLDLKGADLELAQRNSQASIPFAVSSLGYGFLWNNPAIGRAVFGKNITTFEAYSTRVLDYWIVAGDSPAEIVRAYGRAVGTVPEMPEYGLGFWQCKLRYQTQNELLEVAREHKRRGLPMDVLVVDFFHWPKEGEWKFDPTFWPDPEAMIKELKSLGIELMVSIWPTVDRRSENYEEMLSKGLLVRQDRGWRISMDFGTGNCIHFDPTNPEARKYVWDKVKAHYYDKGVKVFWLDEAEPEYTIYDFDIYRYHAGPNLMVGNSYPLRYSQAFYEGMKEAGQDKIVNLVRCAWAGSQKYGALLWSGDVASSWSSFRNQLAAGLNAGLSGISWWTTDIGGFHGGDPNDPAFRELLVRWFQWGAFCPVFRLHGDREPKQPELGSSGGSWCLSGAPNEVWCYGEEVYDICKTYLALREKLRDYVRDVMRQAHVHGDPVIRPVFYDFPNDPQAWKSTKEYMFGPKYLVAPILEPGQRERKINLPRDSKWRQLSSQGNVESEILEGGNVVTIAAPLGYMPVLERI
ncbi:hypothetical protein TruAng_010481 [Truncatella angustata]|nr:hypothetical protein TruAng_010481 [Truncatella angustata]